MDTKTSDIFLTLQDLHPLVDLEESSGVDHLLPPIHNYYQWRRAWPAKPETRLSEIWKRKHIVGIEAFYDINFFSFSFQRKLGKQHE